MGPIGCPETPVRNYNYTLRKMPKECRSHLHRSEKAVEPDRLQCDSSTACDIAQQYFPATFGSLSIHFRKEKLGAYFKNVILPFLAGFKIA
jgi:hypothetical protein